MQKLPLSQPLNGSIFDEIISVHSVLVFVREVDHFSQKKCTYGLMSDTVISVIKNVYVHWNQLKSFFYRSLWGKSENVYLFQSRFLYCDQINIISFKTLIQNLFYWYLLCQTRMQEPSFLVHWSLRRPFLDYVNTDPPLVTVIPARKSSRRSSCFSFCWFIKRDTSCSTTYVNKIYTAGRQRGGKTKREKKWYRML